VCGWWRRRRRWLRRRCPRSLAPLLAEALSPAETNASRFHPAYYVDRDAIQARAFNARSASAVRAKLRNVTSTTTCVRFLLASGILARKGLALAPSSGASGPQWRAVHGRGARVAPTVACAEGCEDISSDGAPGPRGAAAARLPAVACGCDGGQRSFRGRRARGTRSPRVPRCQCAGLQPLPRGAGGGGGGRLPCA